MDKLPTEIVNYILQFDNTHIFRNGKYWKNVKKIPQKLLEKREKLIKTIPWIDLETKSINKIWYTASLPLRTCNGMYKIYNGVPISPTNDSSILLIIRTERGDYENRKINQEYYGYKK